MPARHQNAPGSDGAAPPPPPRPPPTAVPGARPPPGRARAPLRRALSLTQSNLEEARRSVLDLRAAPLEGRLLSEALEVLVERWETETGIDTHYATVNGARPLPPRVEVALYRICQEAPTNAARHPQARPGAAPRRARPPPPRGELALSRICQEALTNVARHAAAGHVDVLLVATPEQVRLVVEDDGRGFEASAVPGERHGRVGMNERARMLGGSLEVRSSPGAGTRVEVAVPLERASRGRQRRGCG